MGWAYCGKNEDTGDEMGYAVEGVCAHPECDQAIDHGLSRLCGDMHADGLSCNRYFCAAHLYVSPQRCHACVPADCEVCYGFGHLNNRIDENDRLTWDDCEACGGTGHAQET